MEREQPQTLQGVNLSEIGGNLTAFILCSQKGLPKTKPGNIDWDKLKIDIMTAFQETRAGSKDIITDASLNWWEDKKAIPIHDTATTTT